VADKPIKHPFLSGKYEGPWYADAAGFVFFSPRGKMLILKRAGQSDWAGRWASAGGMMEEGETPLHAAVRETIEELGALPRFCKLMGKPHKMYWRGILYCTWVVYTPIEFRPKKLNTKEHSQWRWVTAEELGEGYLLHDGFRDTLEEIAPHMLDK